MNFLSVHLFIAFYHKSTSKFTLSFSSLKFYLIVIGTHSQLNEQFNDVMGQCSKTLQCEKKQGQTRLSVWVIDPNTHIVTMEQRIGVLVTRVRTPTKKVYEGPVKEARQTSLAAAATATTTPTCYKNDIYYFFLSCWCSSCCVLGFLISLQSEIPLQKKH